MTTLIFILFVLIGVLYVLWGIVIWGLRQTLEFERTDLKMYADIANEVRKIKEKQSEGGNDV